MRKKDYIFAMTNLILSRVRFHAPLCEQPIDFEKVIASGVDPTLPVLVFSHPMTRIMSKCFRRALGEEKFNLVLESEQKYCKNLGAIITDEDEVKKLNINYRSGLKFDKKEETSFIAINGEKVEGSLNGFFFDSLGQVDGVNYFVRQFVLNGQNTLVEISSSSDQEKVVKIELNILLPKGYYHFARLPGGIKITNLINYEKKYFNFPSYKNKFSFSCVDGVENSSFAKIYLCAEVRLKQRQKKQLFFNFGEQKFNIFSHEQIAYFVAEAQRKNSEKFDVKINCYEKEKQNYFNNILPEKIYRAWLNGKRDEESEINYSLQKSAYVLKRDGEYILGDVSALNGIQIFDGENWQQISIIKNCGEGSEYLQIGGTKFFGKRLLKRKELSSKSIQFCV